MSTFTDSEASKIRLLQALSFAVKHGQTAKETAKAMSVSALVIESGGNEDEAIAALLHQYLETADREKAISVVAETFGFEVAYIVGDLPASFNPDKKYAEHLSWSNDSVQFVNCARNLHELRSQYSSDKSLWTAEKSDLYARLISIYEECDRVPAHWVEEMKILLAGMTSPMVQIPLEEYESLQLWAAEGREWDREFD